jgi:hypothetical protein
MEVSSDVPLARLQHARRRPTWSSQHSPQLLKETIPSLPQPINTRKQAFRLYDEISEAMEKPAPNVTSPRPDTGQPFGTPQRLNTPASRLLDRTASPSGRSQSPRGQSTRKPDSGAPTSSPSPNKGSRSLLASPFRKPSDTRPVFVGHTLEDLLGDIIEGADSEVLARKIEFPLHKAEKKVENETELPENDGNKDKTIVSLSHVLSNIVILQEFILELVAVVQIRASLFQEVQFA